jgi:hypothetical protein
MEWARRAAELGKKSCVQACCHDFFSQIEDEALKLMTFLGFQQKVRVLLIIMD